MIRIVNNRAATLCKPCAPTVVRLIYVNDVQHPKQCCHDAQGKSEGEQLDNSGSGGLPMSTPTAFGQM